MSPKHGMIKKVSFDCCFCIVWHVDSQIAKVDGPQLLCGSCGAVVSAALSERKVAGSISTIGDFHTVGPCKKAVFACLATEIKKKVRRRRNSFTFTGRCGLFEPEPGRRHGQLRLKTFEAGWTSEIFFWHEHFFLTYYYIFFGEKICTGSEREKVKLQKKNYKMYNNKNIKNIERHK